MLHFESVVTLFVIVLPGGGCQSWLCLLSCYLILEAVVVCIAVLLYCCVLALLAVSCSSEAPIVLHDVFYLEAVVILIPVLLCEDCHALLCFALDGG